MEAEEAACIGDNHLVRASDSWHTQCKYMAHLKKPDIRTPESSLEVSKLMSSEHGGRKRTDMRDRA